MMINKDRSLKSYFKNMIMELETSLSIQSRWLRLQIFKQTPYGKITVA